jgi:chemotaxis regulatin CheY-phosphate phosphatase CheZ
MQIDKHPAKHDSQIARLEQVMTALAEAQVKTEESTDRLNLAMAELAQSQRDLARQWQAYLSTIRPQ